MNTRGGAVAAGTKPGGQTTQATAAPDAAIQLFRMRIVTTPSVAGWSGTPAGLAVGLIEMPAQVFDRGEAHGAVGAEV
jgi:hypothetical protein